MKIDAKKFNNNNKNDDKISNKKEDYLENSVVNKIIIWTMVPKRKNIRYERG